jgi:hypothetical protein
VIIAASYRMSAQGHSDEALEQAGGSLMMDPAPLLGAESGGPSHIGIEVRFLMCACSWPAAE